MSHTVRSEYRNLAHKNSQVGRAGAHTSLKYQRENHAAVTEALDDMIEYIETRRSEDIISRLLEYGVPRINLK